MNTSILNYLNKHKLLRNIVIVVLFSIAIVGSFCLYFNIYNLWSIPIIVVGIAVSIYGWYWMIKTFIDWME